MDVRIEDLQSLPLQRRMELVEGLWASIAAELEQLPLSPELEAELRRRREEHLRDPGSAIDWHQLRRRLDPDR